MSYLSRRSGKTDLRECYLSSIQALYRADRLFSDRQQRTAKVVFRRAESLSHRPQRDSGSDQTPTVNRSANPVMNGESNPFNAKYLKKIVLKNYIFAK